MDLQLVLTTYSRTNIPLDRMIAMLSNSETGNASIVMEYQDFWCFGGHIISWRTPAYITLGSLRL